MMATQEPKTVAFVLYPGLTLLDLVGPLQVFASLRQFNDQYRPVVVAERLEPMATDGPLKVIAAADTTPVVGSVCTGALVLAAAGLLEGRQAATHWAYHRLLERLGARYLPKRWVEDGKFITSAGVSAGIDMALALVARLTDEPTARMVQVAIQYDPTRRSGASTGTRWTGTSTSRCWAPWSNSSWPTGPSCWPS
jgi:transcriptional regulator GlxA family with amidase domain